MTPAPGGIALARSYFTELVAPRLTRIVRHAGPVRLIGSVVPFAGRRLFDKFPEGLTIEQMLAADFGAEVRIDYRPDGVVCELTLVD